MSVPLIPVAPPALVHTYFYSHARRVRLEKLLTTAPCIKVPISSNEFFIKVLLDPGGRFTSTTTAQRFQKLNGGYETV